jgi:hypothetical protein
VVSVVLVLAKMLVVWEAAAWAYADDSVKVAGGVEAEVDMDHADHAKIAGTEEAKEVEMLELASAATA